MAEDPQSQVVAFLAAPPTHGLAPGGVHHVRTHISDVFLAGDVVYKIKRAVRYAFVDFTTLEARRAACEAEITLNRRTAPEIYLGTVAIRRDSGGRLKLDAPGAPGSGTPVEWAVVMRRFDESATFDRLAARHELDAGLIDRLVDGIVTLHNNAEVRRTGFGGAEGVGRVIGDNAEDMGRLGHILAADTVDSLITATRRAHRRHAALLDARRDRELVRRCHGDLHLANVMLWKGRPLLFDCIEFSDEIATIDVAYDFAFLLMDLEVRGMHPLANRAMGRYFGRMGETDVLAALPLMLSVRAAVRSKVTAMRAEGEDATARGETIKRANELLDAAARFLKSSPPPRLVAVGGLSGTGKTSLAAMLAPDFAPAPGALHLRSDIIRKRLAGVAPEERLPPDSYTRQASTAVYRTLVDEAGPALAGGCSVILDAVFAQPEERAAAEKLAADMGVRFAGLWLEAPPDTLKARVADRRGDASDATAAVVERQIEYDTGDLSWTRIDAGDGPSDVLERARAVIGKTT